MNSSENKMKLLSVIKNFPITFWIANLMELFERWAWYGMYGVFSIYLTDPKAKGGLGWSDMERGSIQGIVPFILYLLPLFTGALSDRFGYRKTLISAFCVLTGGYFLMGEVENYFPMLMVFIFTAVGAAMFKPVISATIAHTTDKNTSSVGFGIFYAMVNIGGFVGPWVSGILRNMNWDYVFYMSSGIIALNLIPAIFIYKEPDKGGSEKKNIADVFLGIATVVKNWRFMLFLLIFSGFWTSFNQIFITLPLFLRDFVDTNAFFCWLSFLPGFSESCATQRQFNPEWIINIDPGIIILFQVFVSAFVMRFKPLTSMIGGMVVAAIGIGLCALARTPEVVFVAIVVFAFGEMAASPKCTEYIGMIAPKENKALYMGYSFLPVALGNLWAGLLSGWLYGDLAVKAQNPELMWIVFAGLGIFTATMLFLYDRLIARPAQA